MGLYGPGYAAQGSTAWWADQFTALTMLVDLLKAAVDTSATEADIEAAIAALSGTYVPIDGAPTTVDTPIDFTVAPTVNGDPIGAGGGGEGVHVADFASAGAGTLLDPYTGWESALASPAPGTRFYFGGYFATDQQLNFDLSQNVELAGGDGYLAEGTYTGGTMGTVGVRSSKITFTSGNPASWVSARYSWGFRVNGITLANASTTFDGILVDMGGTDPDITVGARFENVTIDNTTTNGLSVACLGLDNVVEVSFRQCAFAGGQYNVIVPNGPWSNAVRFEQCRFIGSTKAPVKNPLAQWTFDSCIIEPMSASSPLATFIYADQAVGRLDVRSCYMWDAGTGAPVFRLTSNNYGVSIVGNDLSSITATQPVFYDGDYVGFEFTGNTVNGYGQAGGKFFDGGVTIQNGLLAGNATPGSPAVTDNSADYVDNENITKSLVVDATGNQLQPSGFGITITGTPTAGQVLTATSSSTATWQTPSGPQAPGPPIIGTATGGNAQATITWTAPASDGGSAITGYQIKTYDGSGTLLATNTVGVVLTYTKTGLTNGVAVKFKIAAINAINTGSQSAYSNTVTPAGPFSPPQSASITTWLKSESLAGANNDPIASWADSGPLAVPVAQATGSKQPLTKTGALNGHPVAQFDGVDDTMTTGAYGSPPSQPIVTFVVAKTSVTTPTAYFVDGVTLNRQLLGFDGGSFMWEIYGGGGVIATTPGGLDTAFHIMCVEWNGASTKLRVDGGAGVAGSASNGLDGLTIGSGGSGVSQLLTGQIAEVSVTAAGLSLSEINAWGAYLAAKFALTWNTAT